MVLGGLLCGVITTVVDAPASGAGVQPLAAPRRVVDTRPGAVTLDGVLAGGGLRSANSTLVIPVAGRASVPQSAGSVIVNVTIDGAGDAGFATVYPCNAIRPSVSNINFVPGRTSAVMAISGLSAGNMCIYSSAATHLIVDVTGSFGVGDFVALSTPRRLVDTRAGQSTVDGQFQGGGQRPSGSVLSFAVAGRAGLPGDVRSVVLSVAAADATAGGYLTVFPCNGSPPNVSNANFEAGDTVANAVVAKVSAAGQVCLFTFGTADVLVDVSGWLPAATYSPLDVPARLLDTRVGGVTADGRTAGKGRRPADGTLRLPVAGRAGVPASASAVVLNITAVGAATGWVTMHPRGTDRPLASQLNYSAGRAVANATVSAVGAGGDMCLYTAGNTDLIIDVVGYLNGPAHATTGADCPDQTLFPHWRMVALYGNDSAFGLGVLGEQPPDAAASRLATVASGFTGLGRPVLGAFEFIATVAQADAGSGGLFRAYSTDDQVQRYLDAARRHGLYLVLDIQPGRSDFLTEVRRYEKFLREPDVGIALDPEWRVGPFSLPGQVIGSVTAAEVNETSAYVARIVAEENLPEKLFVVHQFQERMLPDRAAIVPRAGLSMMYHMDGFGSRNEKLATWSFVKTGPPFHNGFKLFYDEDRNMYSPSEVVLLEPTPDLITYQ